MRAAAVARQARAPRDARRERGPARRPGQPDPEDAGSRDVRVDRRRTSIVHMAKGGVEIRLGTEATPGARRGDRRRRRARRHRRRPVATGFSMVNPLVERLPGADQENVVHAWDVLTGERPVGRARRRARRRREPLRGRRLRGAARPGQGRRGREPLQRALPADALQPRPGDVYGRLMSKGLSDRLNSWAKARRRIDGHRLQPLHGAGERARGRRHRRPRDRPEGERRRCTSRSRARSRTCTGSATASLPASSTTRSTRASSPGASSGIRRSATSTKESSSGPRRWSDRVASGRHGGIWSVPASAADVGAGCIRPLRPDEGNALADALWCRGRISCGPVAAEGGPVGDRPLLACGRLSAGVGASPTRPRDGRSLPAPRGL